MIEQNLKTIGLTNSEIKVYLALLKVGMSSKGNILKEAKIAPSKIYHVLDKLVEKGLASTIIKNNVKHFAAAPVSRIKDYLEKKKAEIEKEEIAFVEIKPYLESIQKTHKPETSAEIFIGWKGIETVYFDLLNKLKKEQEVYILGASKGADPEKNKTFFTKYSKKAHSKKIKINVIFNENSREYAIECEKESGVRYTKRFLPITTPVEILIAEEKTAIVMLKKEPLVILIQDKETAESFISYFKQLWKVAKDQTSFTLTKSS